MTPVYYPDTSEYQIPYDATFSYPIACFRFHNGNRLDREAVANWSYLSGALSKGTVRLVIAYVVFIPGQLAAVMMGLKQLFGQTCPTQRLALMIDMESSPDGFAGPGNHSTEANQWAAAFAAYTQSWARVLPYANVGDYASCWPQIDGRLTKRHVAKYSATPPPNAYSWQYKGGAVDAMPPGAPAGCAPFGTNVDMNLINRSIEQVEIDYGIAPVALPPPLQGDDMPTIVFDQANPARVAVIFGNTIKVISDNDETVALEKAASAAGVSANTPVDGVPTATYDDYIVRFDTLGQHLALLEALDSIATAIGGIRTAGATAQEVIDSMTVQSTLAIKEQS